MTYGLKVPYDEIGKVSGVMNFASFILSTLCSPICGYIMDISGRKLSISISVGFLALLNFLTPRMNSIWMLGLSKTLMEVFVMTPLINPLISDYIKRDSRGLAVSYNNFFK